MTQIIDRGFQAVVTTGIYCRDGCPANPLTKNVRDYSFAAAAEADGYRPCRRCQPERAPQATTGTEAPDLVCRALRLIAAGSLDGRSIDVLARDLGVSERHLRRLFEAHVGTSPDAVARSRRAHLAKRLLDDSDLAVGDVAFAAGFNSLRQMNRVMQSVFHRTPTELRNRSTRPHPIAPSTDGSLVLHLTTFEPFAAAPLLTFLRQRAIDGIETATDETYARTIMIDGAPGMIHVEVRPGTTDVKLRVLLPSYRSLSHVVEQTRRLLDLDTPAQAIDERLSATSPTLRSSVQAWPGMRVPGCWDPFEVAVRAVLGQQVTVRAATTLAARIADAFGERVDTADGDPNRLFPTAETLAAVSLDGLGLPRSRAASVVALSRAIADGTVVIGDEDPPEEVVARLRTIPGIGPWTASYIAMRALGDRDALLVGDVALGNALAKGTERPSRNEVVGMAEAWRPFRSYATVRLWHSLGTR